jgi:hypothetical protein
MTAAIKCACCKRPLRVPENVLGRLVQCPLCLDEFVAQADPAAEAAARAVEAPAKRAAAQQQPVVVSAPNEQETEAEEIEEIPAWVEAEAETAPPKKRTRVTQPVKALIFPVLVTRDPDRILRGRMEAELTADGLYLRQPRQAPAFAAAGGGARYLGANRLVVTVEGREVEFKVVKPWTSVYHLARDAAGYLDGKGDFPNGRTYAVPWILYALPPVFAALPFAACPFGLLTDGCGGVFLWCLIAAALGAAAFTIGTQPRLLPRTRLTWAASLVGLGALIYLLAFIFTPSYSVDPSLWRTYVPRDGSFRLKIPGSPTVIERRNQLFIPDANNDVAVTYSVDVKEPEVSFAVTDFPSHSTDGGFNQFPGGTIGIYQILKEAKNRLEMEHPLLYQTGPDGVISHANGAPYYDLTYQDGAVRWNRVLAARIYVAMGRTYTLTVVGPKVRAGSADVLKFFDSFQIQHSPR